MLCSIRFVIPAFQSNGLLPPGVHWATLPEVKSRYCLNPHRNILYHGFLHGVDALAKAGCSTLYLNGSFVTEKDFPSDYDVCWETAGVAGAALDPVLLDFSNGRAAQKAKFLGEFFPTHFLAESLPPFRVFMNFFQTDKDTGDPKGIVGIALGVNP